MRLAIFAYALLILSTAGFIYVGLVSPEPLNLFWYALAGYLFYRTIVLTHMLYKLRTIPKDEQ